ncbi:Nitrogen fixation protein RnfG [Limihaloglobus sulfuriphilus]|uniref:Nitrogen fixation protein RnfG n=1 Tax=Limihaloglobus sulfuriphilus TaxID=1851148 RepID=A0A1Q2MD58_9BACT|nr:FMN-binding protein [Limihaloglobus sulfuriphilus]AQQ70584.1 Nitrogen fixation protein RnfG [Limihaloglobus sulfuriphilus]
MQNKKINPVMLFIKESWLLIVCSFVFGLLLAAINAAWQPRIEQNKIGNISDALKTVIPQAKNFERIWSDEQITLDESGKAQKVELFKATASGKTVGWAYTSVGPGYADKIELMIAVDANFEKILAYKVLFSNETSGFGDKIKNDYYKDQFKGAPADELELLKLGDETVIDDKIIAISGATISSEAVVSIFNTYNTTIKAVMKEKGLLK